MTFAGNFGNPRYIAVPAPPQLCADGVITGPTLFTFNAITLSQANLNNGFIIAYIHYLDLWSGSTAAASGVNAQLQWQFRNNLHANVGAVVATNLVLTASSAAGLGSLIVDAYFEPPRPHWTQIAIPGGVGAVEVCLQLNATAGGAPSVKFAVGWGVDPSNSAPPGDIGGGGSAAQSANNANTF